VRFSPTAPAMRNGLDTSFQIVHGHPAGVIETAWRACLAESDFPTHYTAPEYFRELIRNGENPFAVLSIVGNDVTGVMTGIHYADRVQSGLSNRPQIAFSRHADRSLAMSNLIAGLLTRRDPQSLSISLYGLIWLGWLTPAFAEDPIEAWSCSTCQ
jgi:hypothetical protein